MHDPDMLPNPEFRLDFVSHLKAGRSIAEVCEVMGRTEAEVDRWRAADPGGFGWTVDHALAEREAELAQAAASEKAAAEAAPEVTIESVARTGPSRGARRPLSLGEHDLTPDLARDFAARIEAGASFRAACVELGLPRATVQRWRQAYPTFDGLVTDAERARGPAPGGRPTDFTEELAETICDRLAAGASLFEVCAGPDMPSERTVMRWLRDDADFRRAYAIAREVQAERLLCEATDVSRNADRETVAQARLLVSTLRWRAGKMAPRVYGDGAGYEDEAQAQKGRHVVFTIADFEAVWARQAAEQRLRELGEPVPETEWDRLRKKEPA